MCSTRSTRAPRRRHPIHDLDFLTLTTTCTQIDLTELFKGGFSTGHGVLREPQDIGAIPALACIAIRATRTISTAVRPSPALITTSAPAWRKPISSIARAGRGAELLLNHDAANDEAESHRPAESGPRRARLRPLKPNKEFDDALRERLLAMTDEATAERA